MMVIPMDTDHLDQVAAIEVSSGDVHWTRDQFAKELTGEFRRFFVVVEEGSPDILAYGGYWKAGPEAQITNLVVRPESRCQGIGRRILEFIMDCARSEDCSICTLEVRASNRHAQSLYKAVGFGMKGTRPKIYENPVEDAVLMEKQL
jgi:[ribosomal protein S18]-alanine N-acetyltransferase